MIGYLFCRIWAHNYRFMFTNDFGRAVLHCTRCAKVRADQG